MGVKQQAETSRAITPAQEGIDKGGAIILVSLEFQHVFVHQNLEGV
jgi:hypothetical protein